MTDNLASVKSN